MKKERGGEVGRERERVCVICVECVYMNFNNLTQAFPSI
jgi:hypothetical protein